VAAPSECDLALSPELAPLFVLDAAIVTTLRFFSILLDPSSSGPGGTDHPPTRALLETMRILRGHIREHRVAAQVSDDQPYPEHDDTDDDLPEQEAGCFPF
jgi:hypothetical protein